MSSLSNFERSEVIAFIFFLQESLSVITKIKSLSAFGNIVSLLCVKKLKACNSVSVKLVLGLLFLPLSKRRK